MKTAFCTPSENCSFLVERYLFIKSESRDEFYSDKYIPEGTTAFVFNFAGEASVFDGDKKYSLPKFFQVTPLTRSLKVEMKAPFDSMIVIFRTSVFSRLFGIDLNLVGEKPFQEFKIFDSGNYIEKVGHIEETELRIREFEFLLNKEFKLYEYREDQIDIIYNEIINCGGTKSLNEILSDNIISQRTFRRRFQKRVGINAKTLSRIVRVNYIWNMVNSKSETDFQNIIFNCRYFDQAHFIKDFKNIVGETPRNFFNRNLKLVEVISGKDFRKSFA